MGGGKTFLCVFQHMLSMLVFAHFCSFFDIISHVRLVSRVISCHIRHVCWADSSGGLDGHGISQKKPVVRGEGGHQDY